MFSGSFTTTFKNWNIFTIAKYFALETYKLKGDKYTVLSFKNIESNLCNDVEIS